MSGLVLASGTAPLNERWGEALRFVPETTRETLSHPGWSGYLLQLGAPSLWAPAQSSNGAVFIALCGRLALDDEQWQRARSLPGRGGLACRWLLDRWHEHPDKKNFAAELNGPAVVLVWETADSALHLFTDRMGICPIYRNTNGPLRLASHADVLADLLADEGRATPLDKITLAECLHRGYGVHPYTYHEGIIQLDAATHYRFEARADDVCHAATRYWAPAAADSRFDAEALTQGFAAALRRASSRRSPDTLGSQALLLSGGADSRALLFAAPEPSRVATLTFCDETNPEARIAERLARIAGSPHRRLLRQSEHYAQGARETVRITGGMWSIKDAHFHGFLPIIRDMALGGLLTGCYTDYLYKGLAYNRAPRRFLGRALPSEEIAGYADEFYQPGQTIAPAWENAAQRRLAQRIPLALRERYHDCIAAVEDLRVRPLSREADAMGRLYLLRTLPWDPVMVDNDLLDFYGRIPPALKLNARLFRAAVLRVLPQSARSVPNNNDGMSLAAPEWARDVFYILHMSGRKLRKLCGAGEAPKLATTGSWPNFRYLLATSEVLAELWANPSSGTRELLTELLGRDPWQQSLRAWADCGSDLILRLISLKLWLEMRRV